MIKNLNDNFEEYTGVNLKKETVKRTRDAYIANLYFSAAAVPLCFSLGGTPMICQARPVDAAPHVPSQSNGTVTVNSSTVTYTTSAASSGSYTFLGLGTTSDPW